MYFLCVMCWEWIIIIIIIIIIITTGTVLTGTCWREMYRVRCRVKQYQTLSLSGIISEYRDTLTPTQTYRPPRHREREIFLYKKKKKKKKKKKRWESKRVRSDISTVDSVGGKGNDYTDFGSNYEFWPHMHVTCSSHCLACWVW